MTKKEKYFERVNDIAVTHIDTNGFEKLNYNQKMLSYYLSQAGLWGRFISLDQGSEFNIPLISKLIKLHKKINEKHPLFKDVHESLFILFAHNGIYHSTTGKLLSLPLDQEKLEQLKNISPKLIQEIKDILFSGKIKEYRTVQKAGVDVVAESGGNFYKNMTTEQVKTVRASIQEKEMLEISSNNEFADRNDEIPPFGFNERLVNSGRSIERQIIFKNGLYGQYIKKIIKNLKNALPYVENSEQKVSIESLIKFYRTGKAKDFDEHSVAWTKDQKGDIYYINGLIESYEDPLGVGCTFESIVAFKNPIQTAKVNKIIDNIQWFENNMPFDDKFKKEKAVGLSASSVTVVSMAGETSPSLPLGINLPNSDWIRKKHGSKSVNLENVTGSRSVSESELRKALYLPEYQPLIEKYSLITNGLHTDLHEIAGHGSGKVLDGYNTDDIGAFYSVIEECRADLVALYFMANPHLEKIGVYDKGTDVIEAAKAAYILYLTGGSFSQLRRIELGNDLTQPHFRNRQLISNWVLENADKDKAGLSFENGKYFIYINDVNHVQELFGKLLSQIQEIKSTANAKKAEHLVMTYGTKVNQEIHKNFLTYINELNLPKVMCAITPRLVKTKNDVVIEQDTDFFEHQLKLHKKFFIKAEKPSKIREFLFFLNNVKLPNETISSNTNLIPSDNNQDEDVSEDAIDNKNDQFVDPKQDNSTPVKTTMRKKTRGKRR